MIHKISLQVQILAPGEGPKRGRGGTLSSRQALLHSLVHIEVPSSTGQMHQLVAHVASED